MADFVKLNGYSVKDKIARDRISTFNNFNLETITTKSNFNSSYFKSLTSIDKNTSIQGVAYNSKDNKILVALVNSTDGYSYSILVELNIDLSLNRYKEYNSDILGHCNDIAYSSLKDEYYITTGMQGSHKNKIAVVDSLTLNYKNEITLPPNTAITSNNCNWVISIDEDNNIITTASYEYIYNFDLDFNLLSSTPINIQDIVIDYGYAEPIIQTSIYYNKKFIVGVLLNTIGLTNTYVLVNFDTNTGAVVNTDTYLCKQNGQEVEGLYSIEDILYIVSGQTYFNIDRLIPNTNVSEALNNNYYYSGKLLQANTDLNTLLSAGKYSTRDGSTTASLLNKPANLSWYGSCTINVFNIGFDVIVQEMLLNKSESDTEFYKFYRRYNINTNTWLPWQNLSDCYLKGMNESLVLKDTLSGYISGASKNLDFSIPVKKKLTEINVNDITILGNIRVRYNQNYVYNNPITLPSSNINVNLSKTKDTLFVSLQLANSGAWITDNNVAVSIACDTLTVNFN